MRTCAVTAIGPFVLMVLSVTAAAAQEHERATPALEISGHFMGIVWGPDYTPGVGLRVTTALSHRTAFEVEVDSMGASRDVPYADEVRWIYALQARLMLGSIGRTNVFATVGGSGWGDRTSRDKTSFAPPVLPTVGIGARHVLGRYVAVRLEAQLMFGIGDLRPVTGRVAAGVSVPIGAYSR